MTRCIQCFDCLLILILGLGFTGCAKGPAPTSYEASHPHAYTPYKGLDSAPQLSEEDRLTRLQLGLLEPPSTMSLVDRAVDSHRRSLESREAETFFQTQKSLRKPKGSKSRSKTAAREGPVPSVKSPAAVGVALPPDLASLGLTCEAQPTGMWGPSPTKSILEQRNCLPQARSSVTRAPERVAVHLSGIKGNLWDSLRGGLRLHAVEHPRLTAFLGYLREKPGTVDFLMGRAEPYLHYLVGELKRQGLPHDLVLVPMVESAFQTTAVSPKQAAGLWQFMAATGQQYGLLLTENYDGRYDTHAATQAALRYLKYLNGLFGGDWLLTLAAYNAGEGTLMRAIQANRLLGGKGTFWELSLPLETQNYVIKILALSKIVADPYRNGFIPRDVKAAQCLVRVDLSPGTRIADLISRSGLSPQEFFRLNPHVRPDIRPPAEAYHFMVPEPNVRAVLGKTL